MTERDELLARRRRHFGRGLSLSYREPLTIVRGRGQYLYDSDGREYLDGVNNVCHVGHAHPRVVEAAARQMAELNTNTRYLHPGRLAYLEALLEHFPAPLEVVYLVGSGSEANDLALRMARQLTGREEVVVLDHAYHGHTQAVIEVSPYKFQGPGGSGCPRTTRIAPCPCPYRGLHRRGAGADEAELARRSAGEVARALERSLSAGAGPAAFLAEALPSVAGQVVPPRGFLAEAFRAARAAGALTIADEVQTGFGRPGESFWAFEGDAVVPDIVTLGKPMGNGHPLAGLVTTRTVAEAFDNGMEYFNTFGGNPVSCAVGLAVLEVIEDEGLQAHAEALGGSLLAAFAELAQRHELVGDVRGRGLFLGLELVRDRASREPAAWASSELVERLRERGILLSVDGPDHNVVKFKPPMVFQERDADRLVTELDAVLSELPRTP